VSEPTLESPQPPQSPDGWELMCAGILRTEFGRRPARAVSKAIIQLAMEEALTGTSAAPAPVGWPERIRNWWRGLQPRPALVFGAVSLFAAGLALWFLWPAIARKTATTAVVACTLSDASNMRWAANSAHPKVGEALSGKPMQLEAGLVELTFGTTAKVAVEGPAQFKLTGPNSMELLAGKISTDVPRHARGFTVKTPTATVVDLGTRFGAIVNADRASEVDVFQGRIQLTTEATAGNPGGQWRLSQDMAMMADGHGAVAATALPETAFPQPNLVVEVRPQNCGFDVSARAALGDIPVNFGYWSGPAYSLITGATQEIKPASGAGMLQFLDPAPAKSGDSEVWQLISMSPYKKLLAGGAVEAKLTALFNRMPGDAHTGKKFGMTLAAFRGLPADAKALWANRQTIALALADKELTTDDQPATWEQIEASTPLPAETDFVIVEIRAIAPTGTPGKASAFAGHFADLVDLKLCTPMRASSIATSR
jgi:hypothetical protein